MVKEFEMPMSRARTDCLFPLTFWKSNGSQKTKPKPNQRSMQGREIRRLLMSGCNPVRTPVETKKSGEKQKESLWLDPTMFKSDVGSLRDLSFTRPDIVYGVSLISRYMEMPQQSHFIAAKIIRW